MSQYTELAPIEYRAIQKAVRSAVFWGRLVKQPCERCGKLERVHAHHEDYTKPLDVVWLCPRHHVLRHRELDVAAGWQKKVRKNKPVVITPDQQKVLDVLSTTDPLTHREIASRAFPERTYQAARSRASHVMGQIDRLLVPDLKRDGGWLKRDAA